jgi:diguanylate cyclase (GGDEF)-like protein
VRALVGSCLRAAGFDVEEAEDGTVALSERHVEAFDAIVTDLRMPKVDGFTLLEHVKRLPLGPEVVILTGSHARDMDCAIRALRLGAHDYLTKPPSSGDEVILTVARAVEKKRLRETNARLLEELQALSRTDGLTGVGNRRAFDEALHNERTRAERYGLPLALVMVDADHFKRINDVHGHPAGDLVLKAIAQVIAGQLRQTDGVFRYGGEEFAVLLPHTDAAGALDVAGRIVSAVRSRPIAAGERRLAVTVSVGVGSGIGRSLASADLVSLADAALYAAKRGGRNRVCSQAVATRRVARAPLAAAC